MDRRDTSGFVSGGGIFHNLGFAANSRSNAFKNLGNSVQIGEENDAELVYCADTTLRLVSPGFETPFTSATKGVKRKWSVVDGPGNHLLKPSLNIAIGHSSSSSDSKGSTATACTSMSKETEEESSMDLELDFTLHLGCDKSSGFDKSASCNLNSPKIDLQLTLSSGPSVSDITFLHPIPTTTAKVTNTFIGFGGSNADEGSTGSPFLQNTENDFYKLDQSLGKKTLKSPGTCTSGITQSLSSTTGTKQCQFHGCSKGARGASGLCISHGGGRRCQRPDCSKGSEGRTALCKAHGGGRRCEFLGCTKSAEGRTDFCIAHGGGRRCSHGGCGKAARGKSGLCIRHGGGKRCQQDNCERSAEGLSGLCISHGGGRRCQHPNCGKGAQGSTMFCKAHGGGKRCTYPDCKKGAEGSTSFCKGHGGGKRCSFEGEVCPKSVHGGTLYCVAHGGGKRCSVAECTKSARGRTDFCVRHGGGKRCKYEGCGKSAQGSTDFCKAHGGGRRCSWGHPGFELGQGGVPCCSFARGKTELCSSHGGLVQDKRVYDGKPNLGVEDMGLNSFVTCAGGHDYVGGQAVGSSNPLSTGKVPEGRVHGGNLMVMLAGNRGFGSTSGREVAGPSEQGKSLMTHAAWM